MNLFHIQDEGSVRTGFQFGVEDTMNRNAKNLAKGAALGMMAGAAVGAAGMYVAEQNPKQLKKAVKKAAHTAEKAVMGVEKLMQNM